MVRLHLRGLRLVLLFACILHFVSRGQSDEPAQAEYALFREVSTQAAAAAAAAAMKDPVGTLGILLAAKSLSIWEAEATLPQEKAASPSDKAPSIDPDLLAGIEDRAPVRSAAENYGEAQIT